MAEPTDLVLLWLLVALLALLTLYLAYRTSRSARRLLTLLDGGAEPLSRAAAGERGFYAATVERAGTLALVVDSFGYFCVASATRGHRFNLFTLAGRFLHRALYGDYDVDDPHDRRRASVVDPSPLSTRSAGSLDDLRLGADGRVLQRLEADGEPVPTLFAGLPLLVGFVALVLFPLLPAVVWTALGWLAAHPPAAAAVAAYLLAPVGLKLYHDTALVGGWDRVAAPDAEGVPPAVADAADTGDPPGTARACLRTVDAGDPIRVLGSVERDDDALVVDGVVTTRGRGFLTVAAAVGTTRNLVWTLLSTAVTAGLAWLGLVAV